MARTAGAVRRPWRARRVGSRRPSRARAAAPRRSAVSTVAPHQMRRPGGASRYAPMSKATPSASSSRDDRPWPGRLRSARQRCRAGSATTRQTDVLERVAGSLARKSTQSVPRHPVGDGRRVRVGARDQRVEPADRIRPGERVEVVLDAQHGRRVDRLAGEEALDELAALRHAEDLRHRPGRRVGLKPLDGARREHDHAVLRLAAEHLLPGEGHDIELVERQRLREGGAGRVADRQAGAVRARSSRRPARARRTSCRSR